MMESCYHGCVVFSIKGWCVTLFCCFNVYMQYYFIPSVKVWHNSVCMKLSPDERKICIRMQSCHVFSKLSFEKMVHIKHRLVHTFMKAVWYKGSLNLFIGTSHGQLFSWNHTKEALKIKLQVQVHQTWYLWTTGIDVSNKVL